MVRTVTIDRSKNMEVLVLSEKEKSISKNHNAFFANSSSYSEYKTHMHHTKPKITALNSKDCDFKHYIY